MAEIKIVGSIVRICGLEMYEAVVVDIDRTILHRVTRWSESAAKGLARVWLDRFLYEQNKPLETEYVRHGGKTKNA